MLLKKACTAWNRLSAYFTEPVAPHSFLLFFRITIGAIALIEVSTLLPDLNLFFASSDTIIPQELMYLQSGYFRYLHPFYQFLEKYKLASIFYGGAVYIYISMLCLLMVGLLTRFSAFVALVLQLLIFKSFAHFNYGYDHFLTMSLFYCLVFPVGKYYALDSKLFKFREDIKFNYRRVLQVHLSIIYFSSGVAKALDSGWWDGNSTWRAVNALGNNYYLIPTILFVVAGIGTVLLELLYPFLIYPPRTRMYALTGIILMHVGIAILMSLYAFSAVMIAWNIAAFGNLEKKVIPRKTYA